MGLSTRFFSAFWSLLAFTQTLWRRASAGESAGMETHSQGVYLKLSLLAERGALSITAISIVWLKMAMWTGGQNHPIQTKVRNQVCFMIPLRWHKSSLSKGVTALWWSAELTDEEGGRQGDGDGLSSPQTLSKWTLPHTGSLNQSALEGNHTTPPFDQMRSSRELWRT